MDLDRAFQVRDELRHQRLVILGELRVFLPAADTDAALGAIAGTDVGAEDMEDSHRLQETLEKLRFLPLLARKELAVGDHLAVGQADEGVEGEEVLVVGRGDFRGAARGIDHQAFGVLARRAQDEGDVLALQVPVQLIEEGGPGDVFQRPLIEVAEHPAELVEREGMSHV
ncbi:hypothetical protein D3C81_1527500 [compost metagenome]